MSKKRAKQPILRQRISHRSAVIDTQVIYCGDNLDQLRLMPDKCVDLIYIDPPFNSNRNYEVFWGETREKRSFEDRHASTQAYIEFMRPRCVEMARVMKTSGSFYYHCDWHASHYVKVMLDQIFGENNFINEIVWKRTSAHNDAKQGSKHLGRVHDVIFFYTGGGEHTFNHQYKPYDSDYVEQFYKHIEPETGRRYRLDNLTAAKGGGDTSYEFHGTRPYHGRYWAYSRENMERFLQEGRLYFPKNNGTPSFKRYLDEGKGTPIGTVWDDIRPVASSAEESVGYPTQKPLSLLERIIQLSSNEGDIVLDAFCGCGTAITAAQNLGRQWIGIDVSPTSCRVMAKRLRDACHLREDEALWKAGRGFVVRGLPWTPAQLQAIPPFEFENWAVIALGGIPNKVRVGDMGIDGRIYPLAAAPTNASRRDRAPELDFMDVWYPIQVKQKGKVGRPDIDAFETAMQRAQRTKGFFVSFDYSSDAMTEIDRFFRKTGNVIIPLTVNEILEQQLAQKLA